MAILDFVVIAKADDVVAQRATEVAQDFKYSFSRIDDIEKFSESSEEVLGCHFLLCSTTQIEKAADIAGLIQVCRQMSPETYIAVVVDSKMSPEQTAFVKKSGANVVLLANEVTDTSKLEFIASQKIQAGYLPVKAAELVANSKIECNLYHLMPLNKKFVPVVLKNQDIASIKIDKLLPYNEIFVKREDVSLFKKYINTYQDKTAKGLASRCRAQFLELTASYIDLVLLILDQSEFASYALGKELYERCQKLADELITGLGAVGEAWQIVTNSSMGGFGSVERGPALASYAGLLSIDSSIGSVNDIMIAAMLSDVGMIDVHPKVSRKIRNQQEANLHAEELQEYQKHPVMSLNKILARKLPVNENIKQAILCSHERADEKGYPNQVRADKVPLEAMLVHLSEIIDKSATVRVGEKRPDIVEVKKRVFELETKDFKRFSVQFMSQVKSHLIP